MTGTTTAQDSSIRAVCNQRFLAWPLIVITFFAAYAPVLAWNEFSNAEECLNVATALEIRRTGTILFPTLDGEPRTKKPPLTAWITSAAIRKSTLQAIDGPTPAVRAEGYHQLALDVRRSALVACCITLVAVFELGTFVGGTTMGWASALVCASTFYFLRFARVSSVDVQLTTWVTVTNAFLAAALFGGRVWMGCIGAGIAAGLAFMTKGPISLLQTILPFVLFTWWYHRRFPRANKTESSWRWPGLVAVAAWLVIALPWYVAVLAHDLSHQWGAWMVELTGSAAPKRHSSLMIYLTFVALFFPWLVYFCLGAWQAARNMLNSATADIRGRRVVLCFLLVIVPLVLSLLTKDKYERYLLPLVGSAAVLAAYVLIETWNKPEGRALACALVVMLAGFGVVAPLLGAAVKVKTSHALQGEYFYRWPSATGAALVGAAVLLVAVWAVIRRPPVLWIAVCAALVMLAGNTAYQDGYSRTSAARSTFRPLAEEIGIAYPKAVMFCTTPDYKTSPLTELPIYLNRPTQWAGLQELVAMPAASVPIIAILVDHHNSMAYTKFESNGWESFRRFEREGDRWYVFVRPALQTAADRKPG